MAPATAAEVEALARRHGLQTVRSERVSDVFGRDGIAWEVVWLRLSDDGTGDASRDLILAPARRSPKRAAGSGRRSRQNSFISW